MKRRTKDRAIALPAGAAGARPIIAIVGRPNVGKSTLFNRLVGARLAIVEDRPGVTRDRHYATAWMMGREVVIIDTGGFDPQSDDPMSTSISGAVRLALEECDVVVCVLDATSPPTDADREAVKLLRAAKKPVLWVANKADTRANREEALELYELGLPHLHLLSALHGNGTGDLEEAISKVLPKPREGDDPALDGVTRVAIVGRPNAGKSSLVNRLVGEARQIVDARPGTTVDSVDTLYEKDGERLVLIDTAGIRKKSRVDASLESLAVLQAIRAMERSDVVVLLIDAESGVAEQDAKICGLAEDRGVAVVLALNKCDLLDAKSQKRAETTVRDVLAFVPWATVVLLSAKDGTGVPKLVRAMRTAARSHVKRVGTAELNRFFEDVLEHHPPPVHRGRSVRLYYITQAGTRPPLFIAISNHPDAVHFSYRRYVANAIREHFGFEGTPIRVLFRPKQKKKD